MPESTPSSSASANPTKLPASTDSTFNLDQYRANKDAEKLVSWVKGEYEKSKSARQNKQLQWWQNMSMFFGNHYARPLKTSGNVQGLTGKLNTPRGNAAAAYRKTINKTRSFVRAEQSKFLSSIPTAIAVPSTATDEDIRAAYAGEQVWESYSDTKKLRQHYSRAIWWMILTGNGFLKTWWDDSIRDRNDPSVNGDVAFGSITPFHVFVPDLREQEIEDQPHIIIAYTKTVEWCKRYFGEALTGATLSPSQSSANQILEEGYLNLSTTGRHADSVIVYEAWVKPGATSLLPDGGVVVVVDNTIVSMIEGLPYNHGMYPLTKFEHIPTSTFYADSPIVDLIGLQREYNELRSTISYAGKVMANPQLIAQKGSIVASRMTNEAGLVIEYKTGYQPPQPLQMSPLPQYYVEQQDRIASDWEDLSGQHDVSRGKAPAGVTAGTAINFLQEKDDQFNTPQYQGVEDGFGKIATSTLMLFNQYVDLPRKIKYVGADQSFDTALLAGADIKNGTDIRIQRGSSIGQSRAASDAKTMDMFQVGLIDAPTALKRMEMGGEKGVLDIMNVAEKKAQRENMKMKLLTDQQIQQVQDEWAMQLGLPPGFDPQQIDPQQLAALEMQDPQFVQLLKKGPPLVVPVDDFDVHDVHIDNHDKFCMGQEYESLGKAQQDQIRRHVQAHMEALMGSQMAAMGTAAAGVDPTTGAPQDPNAPQGAPSPAGPAQNPPAAAGTPAQPGTTLAANGAAPNLSPTPTGGP
jgi:hypothetical protein